MRINIFSASRGAGKFIYVLLVHQEEPSLCYSYTRSAAALKYVLMCYLLLEPATSGMPLLYFGGTLGSQVGKMSGLTVIPFMLKLLPMFVLVLIHLPCLLPCQMARLLHQPDLFLTAVRFNLSSDV